MSNLGLVAYALGEHVAARQYFSEVARISRQIHDIEGECTAIGGLGILAVYQGDFEASREYLVTAMKMFHDLGDKQGESEAYSYLSLQAYQLGDFQAAFEFGRQAFVLAHEVGTLREQVHSLMFSGHALAGLGRLEEAEQMYLEAQDLLGRIEQHNRMTCEAVAGLARIHLEQSQPELALAEVEKILKYLDPYDLCGTEDPFQVYLFSYLSLAANGDERAQAVLQAGYDNLEKQASLLNDPLKREAFLTNIPSRRSLLNAYQSSQNEHNNVFHNKAS
jgi:tetratricopeptide (TPR) repeat protein